jgi:glutamate-ammonia-ligase adenylyltransferase
VVATILDRPRDPVMLRRDVLAMRRDIAAAKPGGGVWDVKLASGGLVDLEFIVHFLQLRDRVAMTPDLRAALVALAAAGTVPDGMIAAHDTLTRILALLRLVVAGPLPKRFPNAVEALLASATGATDFAGAETATGLAKAAVRAAWSEIFALGD